MGLTRGRVTSTEPSLTPRTPAGRRREMASIEMPASAYVTHTASPGPGTTADGTRRSTSSACVLRVYAGVPTAPAHPVMLKVAVPGSVPAMRADAVAGVQPGRGPVSPPDASRRKSRAAN